MFRSAAIVFTALLGLGAGACAAADAKLDKDDIENHCADITENFSGDLFYDENAERPNAVLPDRLAALEDLRETANELETDSGEPAPEAWLTALDELIATLDEITNWQGGMGSDLALAMTYSIHENRVDELSTAASAGGLGEECSAIDDWKFFPELEADA